MGPGAFFRLLWRPAMLFLLFLLFWAVMGPALVIAPEHGDRVIEAFRTGAPSVALVHYGLILGITLPAAFGLAAATASLELMNTRMSWMLPALPHRLTAGIVAFSLPALAAVTWLAARASGPALAIAAFALGLAWFAAFLQLPDAAESAATRLVLGGAFFACMLGPEPYVTAIGAQPAVATLAASVVALVLLHRHTSAGVRRRRMDVASSFQSGTMRMQLYWQSSARTGSKWTRTMTGASPAAWASAAFYEMIGSIRNGWWVLIGGHALIGAIAYLLSPGSVLILCFSFAFSGVQLRAGLAYPMSRRQRAHALFIGNFADVVILAGVAGLSAGMLAALDVPRWHDATNSPPFELPMALALMFAVAPIAQWARVRGPLPPDASKHLGRHMVYPLVAWAATVFVMLLLIDDAAGLAIGDRFMIIGAAIVAAQALHLAGLRWFYATRDLT